MKIIVFLVFLFPSLVMGQSIKSDKIQFRFGNFTQIDPPYLWLTLKDRPTVPLMCPYDNGGMTVYEQSKRSHLMTIQFGFESVTRVMIVDENVRIGCGCREKDQQIKQKRLLLMMYDQPQVINKLYSSIPTPCIKLNSQNIPFIKLTIRAVANGVFYHNTFTISNPN